MCELFDKENNKKVVRESPEIKEARKFLEAVYGERAFHYVETSEKEGFERYHFYEGRDKRVIYVVLSYEERKKIRRAFEEKMGNLYVYHDSIISSCTGMRIQHRFYIPGKFQTSITWMNDDGEIQYGNR